MRSCSRCNRCSANARILVAALAPFAQFASSPPTPVTQERQLEEEPVDSESDAEGEEADGDAPIYNPKNVPLGWDGKPIPYWLYKLHGLNIEYKCEICGNFSYWGPRNFDRHFQE